MQHLQTAILIANVAAILFSLFALLADLVIDATEGKRGGKRARAL